MCLILPFRRGHLTCARALASPYVRRSWQNPWCMKKEASMSRTSRRQFLTGAAAGAAAAMALAPARSRALGANERVRVAIIGAGNQGKRHCESMLTLKDAEI